jgi:excisionase family DNA binding protein
MVVLGPDSSDKLTKKALAARLGLPERTVASMAKDGKIPGRKAGRAWEFSWSAVAQALDLSQDLEKPEESSPLSDSQEVLTGKELAEKLGMEEHTVRRMLVDGRFPGVKTGKIWLTHWPTIREMLGAWIVKDEDLAHRMGLPLEVVIQMAETGQLPGIKAGDNWVFLWSAVLDVLRRPHPLQNEADDPRW